MEATISHEGSVMVIKPAGPLIAAELDDLQNQLQQLVNAWAKRLVVNLSEVPFVDSAGLELLCRTQRQMKDRGLNLKLCGVNEMTQKILYLTRLSRRFEAYSDVATAVRSYL